MKELGYSQNKLGGAEMSVIEKATTEQITEALYQTTKSATLGKWAWQGFIEHGARIGFDYLLGEIVARAEESLEHEHYDRHERAMTAIAIASIDGSLGVARQCVLCDSFDHRQIEANVELACLTRAPKDVAEIRGFVEDKRINGYYLVKACLLEAQLNEENAKPFIDRAIDEAKKIKNPFMHARAVAEIYRQFPEYQDIARLFDDAVYKDIVSDHYLYSRIRILNLYSNPKNPRLIEEARGAAGYHENHFRAESFMAIASIARTFQDLEWAYQSAERIAQEKPNQIWCSLIRVFAGID